MTFEKFNNNPKNKKTGDCVIRAISLGLNKTWDEVFDDLVKIAKEIKSIPNYKDVYKKYLDKYEKKNVFYINSEGKKKRYTVNQLSDLSLGNETFIVDIANHTTVVRNGILYDTWDCGNKSAYTIWIIK